MFRKASCGRDVPLKSCIRPCTSLHCPQTLQFFKSCQLCHFKKNFDKLESGDDDEDDGDKTDADDDDEIDGDNGDDDLNCTIGSAAEDAVADDDALI